MHEFNYVVYAVMNDAEYRYSADLVKQVLPITK